MDWRARSSLRNDVAEALQTARRIRAAAQEAEAQELALRHDAFAVFDSASADRKQAGARREHAEKLWAEALKHAAEEDRLYEESIRKLEAVHQRTRGRRDVLDSLAEAYYERIRIAERLRRVKPGWVLLPPGSKPDGREGPSTWLRRLMEYDEAGTYRARLEEVARLHLETDPPGAEALLERAVEGEPRPWAPLPPLGRTPLEEVPLQAGSYRLTLRRPDRPPVYFPVLLARGEHYRARVPLPRAIPRGYAYVPPGRFLYGSDDDESIRLTAVRVVPMHVLETDGYLIGKHEVTYAEYIPFLNSLAPAERQERRPHAMNYFGSIDLREHAPGRWEFRLERSGQVYSALEGEQVHYRDRHGRRDQQDWRQFPVSSISWLDAREYLKWLDRTGRLPGARLCDEYEWERAARGADGRNYPHGNHLLPDDANFDQTYGQEPNAFGPDMVGSHPASDSPFGISDMAGNVWEWMHQAHLPDAVAYGGGGFYQSVYVARSINHGSGGEPRHREPFNGLRVCAPAPAP